MAARPVTSVDLASPRRRQFTPRAPFDREQWLDRTMRRREEEWREKHALTGLQTFGCSAKTSDLSFDEFKKGVNAFRAGGDSFRIHQGLPPLAGRASPRRLLNLRRRLAPLQLSPRAVEPEAFERIDHNLEMYREGNAAGGYYQFDGKVDEMGENDAGGPPTDAEVRRGRQVLEDLMHQKWKVLRDAFFAIDENRSGKIDRTEFLRVMMHGNLKGVIRENVLKHLMNEVDTNQDEHVDYQEFIAMYCR